MNTPVNLEKEFVPFTESLELKELGFNEPCFGYYNYNGSHFFKFKPRTDDKNLTKAPLYQQAFRWFREKYKLHIEIRSYTARFFTIVIQECKDIVKYIEYGGINLKFNTYEEAELACLKKLIEIVKNK